MEKLDYRLVCTEAKEWLLQCILHPSQCIEPRIRAVLLEYANPQPQWVRENVDGPSNYTEQRYERLDGKLGYWPDLTRHMKSFVSDPKLGRPMADAAGITYVVKAFLRLAFDTAQAYSKGLQTGSLNGCCDLGFEHFNQQFAHTVESPVSAVPLHVRRELAKVCCVGNWQFLWDFVIPSIPEHKSRNKLFFYVYRWVLRAALHPAIDKTGEVEQILQAHFSEIFFMDEIPLNDVFRNTKDQDPNTILKLSPAPIICITEPAGPPYRRRFPDLKGSWDHDAHKDFKWPLNKFSLRDHVVHEENPRWGDLCSYCGSSLQPQYTRHGSQSRCRFVRLKVCRHAYSYECLKEMANNCDAPYMVCAVESCGKLICKAIR